MSPPFCDTFNPVQITLYQCAACQRTSYLRMVIERHQEAKCGQVGIARKKTSMVQINDKRAHQSLPPTTQDSTSVSNTPVTHHQQHSIHQQSSHHYTAPTIVPESNSDPNDRAGYVYLVTCPRQVYSKIGRWSGSLASLKSRYATYYGTPSILAIWCDDAVDMEKRLKNAAKHAGHLIQSDRERELVECSSTMRSFFMAMVGASNDLAETLVDMPGVFSLKRKHQS